MPRSSLTPGPGLPIRDSLAVSWALDNAATAGTLNGDWEEVNFPGPVQVEAVLGALAGTITSASLEIQAADADDADGDPDSIIRVVRFSDIVATDDGLTFVVDATIWKKYARAVLVTAGTNPDVIVTVSLRQRGVHAGQAGDPDQIGSGSPDIT
jgi:hypothetical protein